MLEATSSCWVPANRCVEGLVKYVKGVSSGMELDHASKLLYIADSGNRRIAILNTASLGTATGSALVPNYDQANQQRMSGMTLGTLVDSSTSPLQRPSGLALHDNLVYVTDNDTSKIFAFDLTGKLVDFLDVSLIVPTGGLMGIDFDAKGSLFAVDAINSRVIRFTARP